MLSEKDIDTAILILEKARDIIKPIKKRRITKAEKIREAELRQKRNLFKK